MQFFNDKYNQKFLNKNLKIAMFSFLFLIITNNTHLKAIDIDTLDDNNTSFKQNDTIDSIFNIAKDLEKNPRVVKFKSTNEKKDNILMQTDFNSTEIKLQETTAQEHLNKLKKKEFITSQYEEYLKETKNPNIKLNEMQKEIIYQIFLYWQKEQLNNEKVMIYSLDKSLEATTEKLKDVLSYKYIELQLSKEMENKYEFVNGEKIKKKVIAKIEDGDEYLWFFNKNDVITKKDDLTFLRLNQLYPYIYISFDGIKNITTLILYNNVDTNFEPETLYITNMWNNDTITQEYIENLYLERLNIDLVKKFDVNKKRDKKENRKKQEKLLNGGATETKKGNTIILK
jgi:hypothetical protein